MLILISQLLMTNNKINGKNKTSQKATHWMFRAFFKDPRPSKPQEKLRVKLHKNEKTLRRRKNVSSK